MAESITAEFAVGKPQPTPATPLRGWLASGALQSANGAFCAWLDVDGDTLAFEYPEITGYALTWLTSLSGVSPRELQAGARAADWLVARLGAGDRSAREMWDGGAAYNFDLGMIAAGLISFGRLTGQEQYSGLGLILAAELAAQQLDPSEMGPLTPGSTSSRATEWSTAGRAHLVKCVQALLLAGQLDAARSLVSHTLVLQAGDGRFITQPNEQHVMLHPHMYAVEGLWMWGTAQRDDGVLAHARRATEWVWEHQLPSGGLPRRVTDGERGPEQADVTAQAIRAAVLLGVHPPGLKRAIARLEGLTLTHGDGAGIVYAPASQERHLNAWVTMFGAQALTVASEGARALQWQTLV